jgi:hypothetical protein
MRQTTLGSASGVQRIVSGRVGFAVRLKSQPPAPREFLRLGIIECLCLRFPRQAGVISQEVCVAA